MKTKILVLTTMMLVVVSISFVFAFGVSSPYWEGGNPLWLHPGGTAVVKMTYQNLKTTEDMNVRAEITKGSEIATLNSADYLVKADTKDTTVPITISIPNNAPIGTSYKVTLTSRTVTPGANGGVAFGLGMDTTFDVEVVPVPKEPEPVQPVEEQAVLQAEKPARISTWIIAVIGILVILILLYILFTKNKDKKNRKR